VFFYLKIYLNNFFILKNINLKLKKINFFISMIEVQYLTILKKKSCFGNVKPSLNSSLVVKQWMPDNSFN